LLLRGNQARKFLSRKFSAFVFICLSLLSQLALAQNPEYYIGMEFSPPLAPSKTPSAMCGAAMGKVTENLHRLYDNNPDFGLCAGPSQEYCETSALKYYKANSGAVWPALTYTYSTFYRRDNICKPHTDINGKPAGIETSAVVRCEGIIRTPPVNFAPIYQPDGSCKCPPPHSPPNATARTTFDEKKRECVACPLWNPIPLETLIAQYDLTENEKKCTRKLEQGFRCDEYNDEPDLSNAKSCLQRKMAEVGVTWNGATSSEYRTIAYQKHFLDLLQGYNPKTRTNHPRDWTIENLADLKKENPAEFQSCVTLRQHGLDKDHELTGMVNQNISGHNIGRAFDIKSRATTIAYDKAIKKWNETHKNDANFKERIFAEEIGPKNCNLTWAGWGDAIHFELPPKPKK
jgi:hypothetical protein